MKPLLTHAILFLPVVFLTGCCNHFLATSTPSDLEIYRLGLTTEDESVVQASLRAVTAYPEGYDALKDFIKRNYTTRSGYVAGQEFMKYVSRPGFTKDLVTLFACIDPEKAGANQLATVSTLRFLFLNYLVRKDPKNYADAYIAELPHYLQAKRYRIGFNDTDVSSIIRSLSDKGYLSEERRRLLAPQFIRCFEEAFHSGENQEAMRCLEIITGISPGEYSRSKKDATLEKYRLWQKNNAEK